MKDYIAELKNEYPRIFINKKFKIPNDAKKYINDNVDDFESLLMGIIDCEINLDDFDELERQSLETYLEGGLATFVEYCHNSIIIEIINALTVENIKMYDDEY
ncbi:hypothetical protein [Sphingobacterium sp.]|uniref:hypothetical protein n=1 Tax=Sphingobacterium sp. TaxID=341027 RepID=UPI0028B0D982|nr:hypothetical protein [Sphingobacterium sp.]